ncbi:MAG: hypothetical protein LC708_02540, partial [Actinobacteria bacterium]|nr:hypothetical protein [Actinomycetota bacterium]
QQTSVGFALGFSLTLNDIDTTTRAVIVDTPVDADGAVSLHADSEARIDSLAFGIGIAIAVSPSATAVSVSATGALAFNEIASVVEASLANTSSSGTPTVAAGGPISLTADNDAAISAIALAASASVSVSASATSISVAVGISIAHNRIDKTTTATITNVPAVGTSDTVTVAAHDASSITVVTVAAAISIPVGGGTSVGVSGGAAESTNVVLGDTVATIDNSTLGTDAAKVGAVTVTADSTSTIRATVAGVAATVAVGNNAVGVAVGIAVARNFIGWDPDASVTSTTKSTSYLATVTPGTRVKIDSDTALDGDVFEYLGPTGSPRFDYTPRDGDGNAVTITARKGVRVKASDGTVYEYTRQASQANVNLATTDFAASSSWRKVSALEGQDYTDPRRWKQVNLSKARVGVLASVHDSDVISKDALTITASGSQDVNAVVVAVAVGLAVGAGNAVGISGAGVYAANKIASAVQASIDGSDVHASTVTIKADDASRIEAVAGAASVAAAIGLGTVGVAVSIGLSIGFNEVDDQLAASIKDSRVTSTGGTVAISATTHGGASFGLAVANLTASELDDATSADSDDADTAGVDEAAVDLAADTAVLQSIQAAFAAAGQPLAVAPDVLGTTNAFVAASEVDSADDVTLDANTAASIAATVAGLSAAVGVGAGTAGIGVSLGVAISENRIGARGSDGTRDPYETRAYIADSDVGAEGDLALTARSSETISAIVVAVSAAAGVGVYAGIAVSGAGASASNLVIADTKATISGGGPAEGIEGIAADSIKLIARDESRIKADVVGASVAFAFSGVVGAAISVGVSLAYNEIDNHVEAAISSSHGVTARTGDVELIAISTASIQALSAAASLAVGAAAGIGAAFSGAGAEATNVILTQTTAHVTDSDLTTSGTGAGAGDVLLTAKDTSTIKATIAAVSAAVAVGYISVGASIGISVARNLIGWKPNGASDPTEQPSEVRAYVEGSAISATGALILLAKGMPTIQALILALAVAIAGGGTGIAVTGTGAGATNRIRQRIKAFISGDGDGISAEDVSLTANDESGITADVAA